MVQLAIGSGFDRRAILAPGESCPSDTSLLWAVATDDLTIFADSEGVGGMAAARFDAHLVSQGVIKNAACGNRCVKWQKQKSQAIFM